ncbi:MAG TPA: alpha-amylase family glycosyl hydrolase [Candidatus Limnocylindrales bacterium]|nr:alpha-amylase family glycosyl hydrolase [Candidatus Limnocylindrales bacterium]
MPGERRAGGPHGARPWWETGVLYQIYPRSFQDSNGDGIGDLPGITSRLDYLTWLGVDAIWLSPTFPSPMADFGYDVADYCDVHPDFGTLADMDRLVEEAHRRGLRVLLDFVPNHTSDRHPWFLESRSSRDSPKRDWYYWRDPAPGGGPPNNWLSSFGGGSAWEWDERTGQYYLHSFLKEQPDLNWRNPEVRRAMHDVLRFWFDRGIDGFRIDVLWLLSKDPQLRDDPPNPDWRPGMPLASRTLRVMSADGPEMPEILAGLRAVADEYGDRVLIGETYLPLERLVAYYGSPVEGGLRGVHLPFNFQLILLPWDPLRINEWIARYEAALPPGAWPNWVLGNHDQRRIATRVGRAQARVAAMLLLTLRGTPTIYYGDEIGMVDVAIPPERIVDPAGRETPEHSRDPERTPMQWDDSPNAGFCPEGVEPWLPVAPDYRTTNVAAERDDPRSILSLHRRLIALRRAEPALCVGDWAPVAATPATLVYLRTFGERRLAVALNLTGEAAAVELPDLGGSRRILLSTGLDRDGEPVGRRVVLRPDEGLLIGSTT